MVNTNIFKSNQTKRVLKIYRTITCKSQRITYLPECNPCNIQYGSKSETTFNIRLKNHGKDVSNRKALPAYVRFQKKKEHNFVQHANCTLIEQLTETENVSKATLKLREDFWILKLDTLTCKGLTQELNNV